MRESSEASDRLAMSQPGHFYEFGPFRLDPGERSLLRDGQSVPLTPKAFDVLSLLVANSGHLLKKDELIERVWPGTFVEEVNLAQNISAIRRALDGKNEGEVYIETIPKVGYRFSAPARRVPRSLPTTSSGVAAASVPATLLSHPRFSRTLLLVSSAAALLILVLLLLFIRLPFTGRGSISTPGAIHSLAVLPLANLSSDPAQEYFSEGLTDELITKLAQTGSFNVISRTSVIGYKHTLKKAPEIGRELHVDALVEGTVERVQDRVRIRVQLISTAADHHLWAETYDRDVKDILQLESDVAREITRHIGRVSTMQASVLASGSPISTEAHENYLRGRYLWNQRTDSGIRAAISHFQKAIDLEPRYAQAYAGMADAYIMMANWGFMPATEGYPKAEAAARKALELDDQLAEAHTSLAYANFLYDWDWPGAEQRFRRALELNPNYATAHHFYSVYLMASGRHPEAQTEIKRARELDPLSIIINSVVGWIYYEGRQYPQAIQECQKAFEMDPNYVPTLLDLGSVYLRIGEYDKAVIQFQRAKSVAEHKGVALTHLAQARALSGDKSEARQILSALQNSPKPQFVSPWDLAEVYIALGDRSKGLDLLEKAANDHFGWVVILAVDPAFDPVRSDPRFQALLRRVHIPNLNS